MYRTQELAITHTYKQLQLVEESYTVFSVIETFSRVQNSILKKQLKLDTHQHRYDVIFSMQRKLQQGTDIVLIEVTKTLRKYYNFIMIPICQLYQNSCLKRNNCNHLIKYNFIKIYLSPVYSLKIGIRYLSCAT